MYINMIVYLYLYYLLHVYMNQYIYICMNRLKLIIPILTSYDLWYDPPSGSHTGSVQAAR